MSDWGDSCVINQSIKTDVRLTRRRHVTEQLFTSACVSCANVQAALTASDPACSTAALNRLVEQHTCVQQEEALRSMLFAQLLAAQQQ